MKKFCIYLVQGQADLVRSYLTLKNQDKSDAIFLTYDKPLADAIFFPNSTWAQGRNRLLEEALDKGEYNYYIFCDDDIEFQLGSWRIFEDSLLKYMPAIGVPVFPRTRPNILKYPKLNCQPFFINDEQLIAFHKDVVHDRIVLPYQEQFDKINWWASCEIQQILIQNFYGYDAIQFNSIQVKNTCTERYGNQHDNDKSFRQVVLEWIEKQFIGSYKLTSYYNPPRLHHILYRTLVFWSKHLWGVETYSVARGRITTRLVPGSHLYNQARICDDIKI